MHFLSVPFEDVTLPSTSHWAVVCDTWWPGVGMQAVLLPEHLRTLSVHLIVRDILMSMDASESGNRGVRMDRNMAFFSKQVFPVTFKEVKL